MERFKFDQEIAIMADKNLLYEVVKAFTGPNIDLSPKKVDNTQMGYVFEELIRIGAEQSNEEAGEHFTPREVIRLMVNLLLDPEQDLAKSNVVKTIYDPACGTGGMLSVAENYIKQLNSKADPHLFGQDLNDGAWAVCKADMLIKGEDADNIRRGDSFTKDEFDRDSSGNKYTFDYMLANPPFGVTWKQQEKAIKKEADSLGYEGRFGAGRLRVPMKKSLGNKRRKIGDPKTGRPDDKNDPDHVGDLTRIFGGFKDGETRKFEGRDGSPSRPLTVSKVFDNEDFGFHKITVERPLRLNFLASPERIALLDEQSAFKSLATSIKKNEETRLKEIALGKARQQEIRDLLKALHKALGGKLCKDRKIFLTELKKLDRARDVRLAPAELKAVLSAIGERAESAEICRNKDGEPEPDSDLRDTESVPLKESIEEYFKREVLPHVPDAWIDHSKTKVGYEIPLNRHFYLYEPPRPLEIIEGEIKDLEKEIMQMLKEVTA